jgi:NAD(P)-dependent dehydrogenase (short-subunit alcohol dehydrogenase family)
MLNTIKKALVTGGAMGIGREIARQLLESGVDVIIVDLEKTDFFDKYEQRVRYKIMDVADSKAWTSLSEEVGEIDYLINNAGVQTIVGFYELPEEDWNRVIATNLNGTFFGMQKIKVKSGGRIVNISSLHGQRPRLNKFHYDASKAAIELLTKEVAIVCAERQITVNAVACGVIDTPMNDDWTGDANKVHDITEKVPLSRLGTAEDIANAVLFLLSDKADYITGAILTVDGGRSLVK